MQYKAKLLPLNYRKIFKWLIFNFRLFYIHIKVENILKVIVFPFLHIQISRFTLFFFFSKNIKKHFFFLRYQFLNISLEFILGFRNLSSIAQYVIFIINIISGYSSLYYIFSFHKKST